MFETEAEEWVNSLNYEIDNDTYYNIVIPCIRFGYNKAKEWHYPSKGEYPKDDKDMLMSETLLLITKMKGSDCLFLALGQYNFSTKEFEYQHIVGLTDVIAWQEIVLPKENK